jgi:hypothetical protein
VFDHVHLIVFSLIDRNKNMKYVVLAVLSFGAGVALGLSDVQAAARTAFISPVSGRKGWYLTTGLVQFKCGEEVLFDGELPKAMAGLVDSGDKPKAEVRGKGKAKVEAKAKVESQPQQEKTPGPELKEELMEETGEATEGESNQSAEHAETAEQQG